ncbi:hypothetical protein ACWS81_11720 [Psychrobacter celer]
MSGLLISRLRFFIAALRGTDGLRLGAGGSVFITLCFCYASLRCVSFTIGVRRVGFGALVGLLTGGWMGIIFLIISCCWLM